MQRPPRKAEVEALIREIQRYLAYVEALRAGAPPRQPDEKQP